MKKALKSILSLVLAGALFACGNDIVDTSDEPTTESSVPADSDSTEPIETESSPTETEPDPEPDPDGYVLTLDATNVPDAYGEVTYEATDGVNTTEVAVVYAGAEAAEGYHAYMPAGATIAISADKAISGYRIGYTGTANTLIGGLETATPETETTATTIGAPFALGLEGTDAGLYLESITVWLTDDYTTAIEVDATINLPGYLDDGGTVALNDEPLTVVNGNIYAYEGTLTLDPYGTYAMAINGTTVDGLAFDAIDGNDVDAYIATFEGVTFNNDFEIINPSEDGWTYTQPAKGDATIANYADQKNFLAVSAEGFGTSYEISASFVGTIDEFPMPNNVNGGILAYYQDANNWMMVYAEWKIYEETDRPYQMTSFQPAVCIDGEVTYPSPAWCDNIFLAPSTSFDITVVVTISSTGIQAVTTATIGGNVKTNAATMSGTYEEPEYVGLYGYGDTFTVTNFATKVNEVDPDAGESAWYAINGSPVINDHGDGTLTVTNYDWKNGFVGKGDEVGTEYTISAHMTGVTASREDYSGELMMGFLAWYQDDNNFVIAYVQYNSEERGYEMREMQVTGNVGGNDLGWNDMWVDGNYTMPADGFDFSVSVSIDSTNGATFTCTVNGNNSYTSTQSVTIGSIRTAPTTVGLYSQTEPTTYSNITIQ